ncbi:hypothetical protein [Cellulomonas dongxiuzhuiae]|uniref:Uncharacterized protein n=1 Tax=Cellulomonas dongxiuzhuiae TaxID=2819979 RepID=A0ABX8GMX1_9CELL|nr:hypothetical protein [Cellulomonas dongxiuzhuiae]MBO3095852.1 hypothetical protein [Cellulomonas dongxiuzhuiae]QWC17158.1 hypothetical protein KKR89_06030 [Cellulomonas dongxiuzhuiae]
MTLSFESIEATVAEVIAEHGTAAQRAEAAERAALDRVAEEALRGR